MPLDYGGFILLTIPVFLLRVLVTLMTTGLLLTTEAKKALSNSAFSSSFVTMFSPKSDKGWSFSLALLLLMYL